MSLAESLPAVEAWPPAIEPEDVAALNALRRRRGDARFELAGREASLSLPPEDDLPLLDGPAFRVAFGDAHCVVRLPTSLLSALVKPLGLKEPLEALDPEAAALLLEFAIADDIERLERALGADIEIVARNDATFLLRGHEVPARLELGGATHDVKLWLDRAAMIRFGGALDRLAPPAPRFETNQIVRVCMGWRAVGVADLRDLVPGDVVILESGRGNTGPVAIVGDRLAARLSADKGRLAAASGFAPIAGTNWEWTMESKADGPRGEGLDEAEIDSLPIKLVFELGRSEMPLGEVRRVGAGTVIPLARSLDEAVDIVANGKRIGQGSIVKIGDAVGVRVERLTVDG